METIRSAAVKDAGAYWDTEDSFCSIQGSSDEVLAPCAQSLSLSNVPAASMWDKVESSRGSTERHVQFEDDYEHIGETDSSHRTGTAGAATKDRTFEVEFKEVSKLNAILHKEKDSLLKDMRRSERHMKEEIAKLTKRIAVLLAANGGGTGTVPMEKDVASRQKPKRKTVHAKAVKISTPKKKVSSKYEDVENATKKEEWVDVPEALADVDANKERPKLSTRRVASARKCTARTCVGAAKLTRKTQQNKQNEQNDSKESDEQKMHSNGELCPPVTHQRYLLMWLIPTPLLPCRMLLPLMPSFLQGE